MFETVELILRLVLAGVLGALIGAEREYRAKVAGIRTHLLVALGAALMMIVSRYGFGGQSDPARVAAQIVSGVGFLGAGAIIVQRNSVHGLTTAAGIWVAAGIGMAIAAGLYAVGIATTVLSLIGLEAFGTVVNKLKHAEGEQSAAHAKRAIVSLGSNIEPRADYLARATAALSSLPDTHFCRASSVIETEPVDVPKEFAAQKFLNQIVVLETSLDALTFSRYMHEIEASLGRIRTIPNGPRTIDIDLIDFSGQKLSTPELTLPHPRAAQRDFVLRPLAELGINLFNK